MTGGDSWALRDEVGKALEEGYGLWDDTGLPPLPERERYAASDESLSVCRGENAVSLAVACQCFWAYRRLHGLTAAHPVYATLLGDYFFSVFSKNLIPVDSVALNDEFARFLAGDTTAPAGVDSYLEFVRNLPNIVGS
jgi:hypothetical protein